MEMNEIIENLGNRMVILARVVNIFRRDWARCPLRFSRSRPFRKHDYELGGMIQAAKSLGLNVEFDYDNDVVEITAIIIQGKRFDI